MAAEPSRDAENAKELEAAPAEHGFLGYTISVFSRLFNIGAASTISRPMRGRARQHWPAWLEFNRLLIWSSQQRSETPLITGLSWSRGSTDSV